MPNDPHAISLNDAIALTARWRGNMPAGAIRGARFETVAFTNLLAQPGCAGIRIYLGMNDDMSWTYVMVAVDAKGSDIISANARANGQNADGSGLEEMPPPCPPDCDVSSPLNGGESRR
jgi:hypothetical protein